MTKRRPGSNIINLLRCAWAGSQRYGGVWSGPATSTPLSDAAQPVRRRPQHGPGGHPWWTTDIGGFHGGDPDDPAYRELLARWFAYGAFCPVFRLHGFRDPHTPPLSDHGGGKMMSGAANKNEVWIVMAKKSTASAPRYMFMRERLKPYITGLMQGRITTRHTCDGHAPRKNGVIAISSPAIVNCRER